MNMNQHILKQFEMTVALKNKIKPKLEQLEKNCKKENFRLSLIEQPLNSIALQILIFKANEVTFYSDDWYDSIYSLNKIPQQGRVLFTEKHDVFVNYMVFIQFISKVESELRKLIRIYDPEACSRGKGHYEAIYKKILKDFNLCSYTETFDFANCLRNLIHNNGYYMPKNNTNNRIIKFRDKEFLFEYGKVVNFFSPELIVEVEDETFNCLFEIVNHKNIGDACNFA